MQAFTIVGFSDDEQIESVDSKHSGIEEICKNAQTSSSANDSVR